MIYRFGITADLDQEAAGELLFRHQRLLGAERRPAARLPLGAGGGRGVATLSPARQRSLALAKGNRIRIRRAELKRTIATLPRAEGRRLVAELVENPTPEVKTARLGELLTCIRNVGGTYATMFAFRHGVGLDTRLRELTVRERIALGRDLRSDRGFPQARRAA